MSWEKIKLGDIAEFSNGINFDKSAYAKGIKLIGVSSFGNRFFPDYDSLEEIKEDVVRPNYYLQDGDIVFVRSNGNKELVGRCMLIKEPTKPITYSGFCIRARIKDTFKHSPVFFTYLFKSAAFRKAVTGTAIGANIQNLSQGKLASCEIQIPDIKTQHRIASILSAYDNLIENNQKQIKLLEEAAQRLYKEWFVDLRFPGYENTPVVDGVPEGWAKGVLGDVAENSGRNEKMEHRDKYSYYLPIDCLPKKSLAYIDTNEISLAESSLVAFKKNDIIFGAMRPYFHKVVIARDEGLTRSTCFVINAQEKTFWSFLAMLLFAEDTVNYATRISVGTTMPYVRWKDFVQMPVLIPSKKICMKFNKQFIPISQKIARLAEQNIRLTQARDRLLPKLMSGELEVRKMVIEVEKFKQNISQISGIPICNDVYTFFYDETGNCRKFSLSEKGFNSQSAVENNFILAGVLFPGTEFDVDFDELYSSLGYSEEQKELKFKHLYHNSSDFLTFIGSKRASAYLSWLSASGLYVHYSTLNNLYYSLVDIIDSLWELYPDIICNPMLCNDIKSAFYDFTIQHTAEITQILIDYGYPNIQNCTGFCEALCDFIRSFNDENDCYPGYFLKMLRQMLKQAGKQGKLIWVQDNIPNKLIDEYYLFYLERCELFSKSYHIFDEEITVQNKLKYITLSENGVEFCNYEFQNSIDNRFIQVSDLFCGFLSKLFYFLDKLSEEDLPQIKSKLNNVQKTNIRCVYELILKSDNKCPLFLKNTNASNSINLRIKKLMILSY